MTISTLSYANNFGDWFLSTNALIIQNNTLETGNYTKTSGIITINSIGTGLQVNSNAVFSNTVQITGVNSSLTTNNLTVTVNTNLANANANNLTSNNLTVNVNSNLANVSVNTLSANVISSTTVSVSGKILYNSINPISKSAAISGNTISASELYNNSIIQYIGGSSTALVLPSGTSIESVLPVLKINTGFDFYIINTNAGTPTLTSNTGISIVGNTAIVPNASAHFRVRRTAANVYVTYRLS